MKIELAFTLSTGGQYTNGTSDFESLEKCRQDIASFVSQESNTLTFNEPSGANTVIVARHVVAVKLTPAGAA